jgi:3-dehydroquinate dehydratase/shikimate dehydrogenase
MTTNKIAISLALVDTKACLEALATLASRISLAEIRLDAMNDFALPRLIAESPCPLIMTCRPPREGGSFAGAEAERLAILAQAIDLGCAYVDIEWDSLAAFAGRKRSSTKIIASRHWHDHMPADLRPFYEALREEADVVKLVGLAQHITETLPVFDLLWYASSPVIGLAMGAAGQLTRLLAPCFPQCLLTYAAPSVTSVTASGQLSIADMTDLYHVQQVGPQTRVHLHLSSEPASAQVVLEQNQADRGGETLHIPLEITTAEAQALLPRLRTYLPYLTVTADSALAKALDGEQRFIPPG